MATQHQINNNMKLTKFLGGKINCFYHNKTSGYSDYSWDGELAAQWRREKLNLQVGDAIVVGQLRFHESWDWLLPVWDKILILMKKHRTNKGDEILGDEMVAISIAILAVDMDKAYQLICEFVNNCPYESSLEG